MSSDWADGSEDERQARDTEGDADVDREWHVRKQAFWQNGYRAGLDEGTAQTVQQGFDQGFANGAASGRAAGRKRGLKQTLQLQSEQALSDALANSPTEIPAPPGAKHPLPQDDNYAGVDGSQLTSADSYASRDIAKEHEDSATTVSAYGATRNASNVQPSPTDDNTRPQSDVPRVDEHLGSPERVLHVGDSSVGHDYRPVRQH